MTQITCQLRNDHKFSIVILKLLVYFRLWVTTNSPLQMWSADGQGGQMTWEYFVRVYSAMNLKMVVVVVVVSQFNGTSTPKGSYTAKTGDNGCNVNSCHYSLSTPLCESNSLSGKVWRKCPTRPDTQGRHVEAALMHLQFENGIYMFMDIDIQWLLQVF